MLTEAKSHQGFKSATQDSVPKQQGLLFCCPVSGTFVARGWLGGFAKTRRIKARVLP